MRLVGWSVWGLLLVGCWPLAARAGGVPFRITELASPPALPGPVATHPGDASAAAVQRASLHASGGRTTWFEVRMAADWHAADAPLLAIGGVARVTVYLPPDYRPQTHRRFDATLDPAYSHRATVYTLPPGLRADQPIYISMPATRWLPPTPLWMADAHAYRVADMGYLRTSTLLASVLLSMMLVIACYWVVLRDRMFVYFVAYVAAELVYTLWNSGELFALPGAAILQPVVGRIPAMGAALACAFSIWFNLDFADLRRCTPRLARSLRVLAWLALAYAAMAVIPWLDLAVTLVGAFNLVLVAACLLSLAATWLAWRQGNRQAGFYLLAWLPLLVLAAMRAAQLVARFPLPDWLEFGFPASMAWSAVIITAGLADRTLQARRERDHAARLAQFDPLTGIYNRRTIMEALHAAWGSALGPPAPLAVLFLDIDHFKQINDSRGHAAGDACLRALTGAIRAELGEGDGVGRYGGEEFLVMLRGEHALDAEQVAGRIVARVAALRVEAGGAPIALTASIGVAVRESSTTSVEALVENADGAQYQAKAEGRNRVVVYRREGLATPAVDVPIA